MEDLCLESGSSSEEFSNENEIDTLQVGINESGPSSMNAEKESTSFNVCYSSELFAFSLSVSPI